jgi:DNA polymerase-3 subunit delta'
MSAGPVPELFAEVVGQEAAVATLVASAPHPVHAYLFLGPAGSGRRAAARAFAAALLCPAGGDGTCSHCRRALAGTHPDLVVVERAGAAVGVDQARRLVGLAQRRPLEAARQVLVVTDVHLALRSAPALLKTLEEPPAPTVFVLLAEAVPPELVTVASRCAVVRFSALAPATIAAWLEGRGVDPVRADLVAETAGGDLDRARLLAEDPEVAQRLAAWRSVPDALDGTGAAAARLAHDLADGLAQAAAPLKAHQEAELARLAADAEAVGERGVPGRREVTERHRREEHRWRTDELRAGLAVLSRAYQARLAHSVAGDSARERMEVDRCGRAVDLITTAATGLPHNPNELLLLEALLVRLSALGA